MRVFFRHLEVRKARRHRANLTPQVPRSLRLKTSAERLTQTILTPSKTRHYGGQRDSTRVSTERKSD